MSQSSQAQFVLTPDSLKTKYLGIKALISDWDGVFNAGIKTPNAPSPFSEADSMGLNLLRYEFWQRTGTLLPIAIITGADNPAATYLAQRERLAAVYGQIVHKAEAVAHFCAGLQISPAETACFFDDANDLGMAKICGLRFLIRRNASPLFTDFVHQKGLCDYISGAEGGQNAWREITDNLLHLTGNFENVLQGRMDFSPDYQQYYTLRQAGTPQFFKKTAEGLVLAENVGS
jgi:3-deoxy-D-manno-octulosonate 8-phosphate phosphatase (KDO 8-P phosphatase)